jgi:hypothetical protein
VRTRCWSWRPRRWGALAALPLLAFLVGCGATATPAGASSSSPASTNPGWVKDTVHDLDIFLPDANSDYYLGGFGTKNGARTVISGKVPKARYWSFTAYPPTDQGPVEHVHDSDIIQSHGRYTVTLAASCARVKGTCLATTTAEPVGIVVLRLYVPVDLSGSGTGGVPLPTISYANAVRSPVSLARAAGTTAIGKVITSYQAEHGALPAALIKSYPPDPPVPTSVVDPPPKGRVSNGSGRFNNPDNTYEHVRYTTTRGNLVVSAQAPTFQADSFPSANDLARPAKQRPQVRYWSLCIVLTGLHTGDCLRDAQIRFPAGSDRFTVIVAPTCPVTGYLNCLVAGPEPLQVSLAYRFLLPSATFTPKAFRGPYGLTAAFVGRPG